MSPLTVADPLWLATAHYEVPADPPSVYRSGVGSRVGDRDSLTFASASKDPRRGRAHLYADAQPSHNCSPYNHKWPNY